MSFNVFFNQRAVGRGVTVRGAIDEVRARTIRGQQADRAEVDAELMALMRRLSSGGGGSGGYAGSGGEAAGGDSGSDDFAPYDSGTGGFEVDDAVWERMWKIHGMAHVWAARAVVPEMVERGEGGFVVTASAAGLLNIVETAPYGVTKHASVAFAEWLRIGYGRRGVRVSCLCPQGVRTHRQAVTGRPGDEQPHPHRRRRERRIEWGERVVGVCGCARRVTTPNGPNPRQRNG